MAASIQVVGQQLADTLPCLSIPDKCEPLLVSALKSIEKEMGSESGNNHHGDCAICLNKILLLETALVKGCEHAYCVTCILRWASYKKEPTCPQCKHPFDFLHIHRSLDGSIQDFMCEESVCLLLRATWFKPLIVEEQKTLDDEMDDLYLYDENDEDDDEALEECYLGRSSRLRIGNRRWGDSGYVRGGRQEARPRPVDVGPSRQNQQQPKKKETFNNENIVKRETAKKAAADAAAAKHRQRLKREASDKAAADAAAAKHRQRLIRLGKGKGKMSPIIGGSSVEEESLET